LHPSAPRSLAPVGLQRARRAVRTKQLLACVTFLTLRCALVVLIADVFQPLNRLAIELFLDGNVRHRGRERGTVPMFLAGSEPDDIARPDLLDRPTRSLHAP